MTSPQQHLDDHYGDVGFVLVNDDVDEQGGMSEKEANTFLRGLRPVVRAGQTLAQAVKKAKTKG